MSIFAILDADGIVQNRVDAENEDLIRAVLGENLILIEETEISGPASIGYKMLESGVFQSAQPYPSWSWNDQMQLWSPPVEVPEDGQDYFWNEESQSWNLAQS